MVSLHSPRCVCTGMRMSLCVLLFVTPNLLTRYTKTKIIDTSDADFPENTLELGRGHLLLKPLEKCEHQQKIERNPLLL